MASLFSSRLLLRHTKPSIHSLARVTPLALLVRPFSHTPLPHSSSPFDPPSSSTLDYSQLHPAFKLVPAKAINHQTPLRLAHSPEEERDGKMRDLPRPKREMDVGGEGLEVPSETDGGKVYLLKRFLHHGYSCTCLSWQFQKKRAIDVRSCKHLRGLLGDEYEDARTGDSGRTKAKKPTTTTRKTSSAAAAVASTSAAAAPAPPASKDAEAGATKKPVKRPAGAAVKGKGKGRAFAEDAMEDEEASPLTDPEDGDVQMADALGIGKGKGKGKMSGRKGGMDLLLANKFDLQHPAVVEGGKKDPRGWWVSEKLDGVRAYWDGQGTLWSRVGNPFSAPASFLAHLPRGTTLDGELFLGRDRFDETSGIVRTKEPGPRWGGIRYLVFDIPSLGDSPFEARQSALESLFPLAPAHILSATSVAAATAGTSQEGKRGEGVVWTVRQEKCKGLEDLKGRLEEVSRLGGEGLMLRLPHSPYIPRRSSTLLKVKTFHDAEAVVVAYEPGKGKYEGMVGALVCRMERGEVFSVGSGLTDERRGRPPPIGSTITYRFQELTKAGIPRFPTFVGERADLQGAKDAKGVRRSA